MEGRLAAILVGALYLVACGPTVGLGSSGNDDGTSDGAGTSTGTSALASTSGGESTAATDDVSTTDSTSTGTLPVGPEEVLEGCEADRYRAGLDTDTPVHAIVVLDTGLAEFDIEWSLPGDGVLVLSTLDPIHWRVTFAGAGSLSRIVVNGLEGFTVDAPQSVEVEQVPEPDGDLWTAGYPSIDGERVRVRAEHLLDLPVTGMDICSQGATSAVITPHNALGEPEPPPATGCERALSGQELCVFSLFDSGRYSVLDPYTGDVCHVNVSERYFDQFLRGWGVKDPLTGYTCTDSPYIAGTTVAEVDLVTGLARWSAVPCERVYTSSAGHVLVYVDEQVRVFDDVFSGSLSTEYMIGPTDGLAADAEILYQLTGDNIVQRWSLNSGEFIDSVQLPVEGDLDWFAVTGGRLLARDAPTLYAFDSETGELLESVAAGRHWPGELSCIDRPKI